MSETRYEVVVETDEATSFRKGVAVEVKARFNSDPIGIIVGDFWRALRQGQATELSAMTPATARKVAVALLQAADTLDEMTKETTT